jgi:hypothetical protein
VRSVFLIKHPALNPVLIKNIAQLMARRVTEGKLTIETVNGLIFAQVLLGNDVPEAFKNVVTPAILHDLVYEQYQLGMRFGGSDYKKHFEMAAKLAELADVIHGQ